MGNLVMIFRRNVNVCSASRNHSLLSYYLIFSIYKRGRVFTRNRGNGLHRLNITTLLLSQFATWVKSKHDQSISHGPIGTIVGKRDFASLNQIYEFSGWIFRIKFPWILAERVPTFSQLWLGLKWTIKVKSQTCIRQWPRYKILPSGLGAEIYCNREKKGLSGRIGTFSGPFQGQFGTLFVIFIIMLKKL